MRLVTLTVLVSLVAACSSDSYRAPAVTTSWGVTGMISARGLMDPECHLVIDLPGTGSLITEIDSQVCRDLLAFKGE